MNYLLLVLSLIFSGSAYATSIAKKTLPELVADSDHVVVGTVKAIKMHTWFDFERTDPKARTGPGGANEIRWTVELNPTALRTTKKTLPKEIVIKQWKMWHMDLEGAKHHEGKTYIFLLKGDDMQWVYPAWYYRNLTDRPEIEALLNKPSAETTPSPSALEKQIDSALP